MSLGLFAAPAAVAGVAALGSASRDVGIATIGALALAALTWVVASMRGLKTAVGELLAAAALVVWSVPVALAGGVSLDGAIGIAALWCAAFAAATLAVRGLIARSARRNGSALRWGAILVAGVTLGALIYLALADLISTATVYGFLPCAALTIAVAMGAVPVRRLRSIGWGLVAASLVLLSALVVGA
jgi:hypothetical protein